MMPDKFCDPPFYFGSGVPVGSLTTSQLPAAESQRVTSAFFTVNPRCGTDLKS
jgi:hypothetical protein